MTFDNYECEGQMDISEYFARQLILGNVMGILEWIDITSGPQYEQIQKIISGKMESGNTAEEITREILEYIEKKSRGYMEYLKKAI